MHRIIPFIPLLFWGGVCIYGIRIINIAKQGCDLGRLKITTGTTNITKSRTMGWAACIIGGLMFLGAISSTIRKVPMKTIEADTAPRTSNQLKDNPEDTKMVEEKMREQIMTMNQTDADLVAELSVKAISLLPPTEREQVLALHRKMQQNGENSLTEEEHATMQTLDAKGVDLLPEEDKIKLESILLKMYEKATSDIK